MACPENRSRWRSAAVERGFIIVARGCRDTPCRELYRLMQCRRQVSIIPDVRAGEMNGWFYVNGMTCVYKYNNVYHAGGQTAVNGLVYGAVRCRRFSLESPANCVHGGLFGKHESET
mgnify:FL=1